MRLSFGLASVRFWSLTSVALACGLFFSTSPVSSAEPDPVAAAGRDWTALITMQDHAATSINAVVSAYQTALAAEEYWRDACQSTPECGGLAKVDPGKQN